MELQRDPHLGVTVVGSSSQVTLPTAVTVGADPVSMVSLGLSPATANASAVTTVVSTHLDLVSAQPQSMPQSSTPQTGTLNITAPCTPQLQQPDQLQHADQQQDLLDLASAGPGQGTHLDSNQTADLVGGNSLGQLDQTEWQDATFQAADSNSPKQTFVPCKVCGDKASGYHYGVTSCEGCKGFFRRSIQKQIEYRCLRDGKCLVIRLNRNRCQYCRFKKCLAVGMSRDSVRYGRVPKRSKSTDEQRVTTTDSSQEQTALESKQLAIYDIILTISQAHHANSVFTEDKIKSLNRKSYSLVPKTEPGLSATCTEDTLEMQRLLTFQNLAVLITPTIQRVVEFAKRVPGFHDLSQDDQLILIKAGFFEIWLTRITRMFNMQESTLTFGDGSVISKEHLEVVYPLELVSAMFDFASSFAQLHLNDTEVGLFTAVVLAAADRPGLTDMKGVERIQDKLIEALKLQISRNHSTEPHLFANILMKLPELRTLGTKHADNLQWFRQQWPRLRLPPLFAEIYDIPKTEEDLQS